MEKNGELGNRKQRSSGVGGASATVNRVIRGGLMEKVMFKQRHEGDLLI